MSYPLPALDRRSFLGAAAACTTIPWGSCGRQAFANTAKNDRPRIGCIGLGKMGMGDAHQHSEFGDILAVCDVDDRHSERARNDERIGRGRADAYNDYRRVLDRDDIDVVSIVTPDHWHVKVAIEALQSGKHVFCQKPLTLTLEENRLIRQACQTHPELAFVVGTQQRGDKRRFLRAVNLVRKGLLGEVTKVTCGINGSPTGGPFKVETPPAELDWDRWLGPAPKTGYMKRRCHYEFRWWYEYSGGKFTDWGAHHIDIALWALGLDQHGSGPTEIDGADAEHPVPFENGRPTVNDSYNTSHDFNVVHRFPSGLEMHVTSRGDNGILFEGSKGRLFVNRRRITGRPVEESWDKDLFTQDDLANLYKGKPHEGHKANFFRCVREGGLPVSDVFSHVQTMNACHLSSIAARLGRTIRWDPQSEQIMGDDQASAMMSRAPRSGFEYPEV
ncbi:Gfo/Idh/MocA family protein [Posidoniimonas corsicana]|nr:Gfo/Idh/MocA family oxidoreductase [Posidoniimonas corsicana]